MMGDMEDRRNGGTATGRVGDVAQGIWRIGGMLGQRQGGWGCRSGNGEERRENTVRGGGGKEEEEGDA